VPGQPEGIKNMGSRIIQRIFNVCFIRRTPIRFIVLYRQADMWYCFFTQMLHKDEWNKGRCGTENT
jgi:hypothetical protein